MSFTYFYKAKTIYLLLTFGINYPAIFPALFKTKKAYPELFGILDSTKSIDNLIPYIIFLCSYETTLIYDFVIYSLLALLYPVLEFMLFGFN